MRPRNLGSSDALQMVRCGWLLAWCVSLMLRSSPGIVYPIAACRLSHIPDLVPDLAVEVLSAGNTPGEMARKRQDYFAAGVQVVWEVNPSTRTVEVFTTPDHSTVLHEAQTLDGGMVLPGFTLPLQELFS